MKRRGLKVKTGVRAPALIERDRHPFTGKPLPGRFTIAFDRAFPTAAEASGISLAAFVKAQDDEHERRYVPPVGLLGVANMAPLVVGPRCVVDPPCGLCWYCKTWPEREPRFGVAR